MDMKIIFSELEQSKVFF